MTLASSGLDSQGSKLAYGIGVIFETESCQTEVPCRLDIFLTVIDEDAAGSCEAVLPQKKAVDLGIGLQEMHVAGHDGAVCVLLEIHRSALPHFLHRPDGPVGEDKRPVSRSLQRGEPGRGIRVRLETIVNGFKIETDIRLQLRGFRGKCPNDFFPGLRSLIERMPQIALIDPVLDKGKSFRRESESFSVVMPWKIHQHTSQIENDRVHDFVHRTLKVGGSVTTSGGYVTDSISFSFPIDHDPTLDLAVEGYYRLDEPGQTIIVDLSLNNRSEIPLTDVQLSSLDLYGKEPLADSFSPKSLAYLMPLFKTYGLLYTICPTQEEIDKGEVIRSVTVSAEPDGITDTVYLHYLLNSEKVESEILHLEGKMMSYPLLGLEDLFEADITATNAGNVNLEDIVIQLVVQSADGSVLLNSTYGSSGQGMVYGPGKGVQCFPKISISKQMLAAGLAAKCLNSSCEAKTLTFTFTGLYARRHSDSQIVPGVSNSVSFTVNLKGGTGGISVHPDLSMPAQTPKAGEKLYVPLIIENVGKEDLVGLQLDVSKAAMNTFVYVATLINNPFDIIHPGETRPYTFEYTVTEEDVEKGNAGFLFTASSESSTSTLLYVDSVEYNKALSKEPEKKLLLTKSVTNTPPGGQTAFRLGNEIYYLITITNNTGEDLDTVRVYDDITGYASPVLVSITSLKDGETRSIPFTHVVCPLDVAQLQVENQAYANYTLSTDPMPPTAYSNYVNTPVEETPEEREIVVIEKKLNNASLDPKGYALGETIDYLITVTSQHKESVVVDVWDDVWGTEAPEMIASITLHPGETRSFSHSYQVREVDLPPTPDLIGSVINEAYALNPPTSFKGKKLKIYYTTQVTSQPPTFVFFVNNEELLKDNYKRYLENKLREAFGFFGNPIRLSARERKDKK